MSSVQLQLQTKYNDELTQLLQSRILENLDKFDNGNNAAGTRARVASQELIKLLKSLRVDVLTTQKDKKAERKSPKSDNTEDDKKAERKSDNTEDEKKEEVSETSQVQEKEPKKKRASKKKSS